MVTVVPSRPSLHCWMWLAPSLQCSAGFVCLCVVGVVAVPVPYMMRVLTTAEGVAHEPLPTLYLSHAVVARY